MNIQDYVALFPGISAVVTGVLAFIVTIIPPQSMKSKIWWLIVFVVLAVLAIYATFWQQSILNQKERISSNNETIRNKKDADRDIAFAYMGGQMNALIKLSSNKDQTESSKELRQQMASELASFSKKINTNFTTKQSVFKSDIQSLKDKCLILSYKLNDVFSARAQAQSVDPRRDLPMTSRDYDLKTAYIYAQNYASQVAEIHDALAARGLTDSMFDSVYNKPTDAFIITEMASRIQTLAYRLK